MIYTVEQLCEIITPIAKRYDLPVVYLFGSYARGTANDTSDVDLLVDTAGTQLKSLMTLGALYCELEEALKKPVDLITVSSLQQSARMPSEEYFENSAMKERIMLYSIATAPEK